MSDAQALEWLDRLLGFEAAERQLKLQQLSIDEPALHQRLLRLLSAAAAPDCSQILALPVVGELRAVRESATLALDPGQSFAGYRLLRELGRGGMSVVWLAERVDGVVKRQVALKLPLFVLSSALDIERFAREKDVLAGLTHPNIARLYDAGVAPTGQPFIVLEFVDGIPITAYSDRKRSGIDERLGLFIQVLGAVDHAHKHLVVHRDLKPSNILVDAQGQVKLLDFGIARLLGEPKAGEPAAQLTQQGALALTPLYAAPEQLSGQAVGIFTDVYVLGVVLHELLSGALPYADAVGRAPELARVLDVLLRGTPTRPSHAPLDDAAAQARGLPTTRRLRAALLGDLDTIVRKAMAHVPAQRYGSAEHLSDDIRRYLARKPIGARPPGVWYSTRLFLRRHRNASVAAMIGVILSLFAGVFAAYQSREASLYEARGAAVRDFMFDLVNDAEPNESQPDAPVTFLAMLDGAVIRARSAFRGQPALEGELLNELGRMYLRLGDTAKSTQVMTEALSLLGAHASADDPALNKARANVATALLRDNDLARARDLATAAIADCTRNSIDCAKARAYAFTALATIQQREGQAAAAMSSMRAAVRETIRGFGEGNAETAMTMLSLAVSARNTGHLREAMETMTRAMAISEKLTLRKADRTELVRTMAVLDLDMGRYESARHRLTALLAQPTDRGERALQLRFLSNVLLEQGEAHEALRNSDAALSLAEPQELEALYARQNRARALALLGQGETALAQIDLVISGLRSAGISENARPYLRAQRFRAEILLRSGHLDEASRELQAVEKRLRTAPDALDIELGQVKDLEGCVLRELHRSTEAVPAHAEARTLLAKELPPGHPFLKRNTLYQDAARRDVAKVSRDAMAIIEDVPPDSDWRRLIEAQIHPDSCAAGGALGCILVL